MPTPYNPLTATGFPPEDAAMIWPWPHNWATAFVRRPEWKTAITMSATGVEQRQALREYPRESITIENLLTDGDAATATSLLRAWKGNPWLVPDWSEMTTLTDPAGTILSLARQSIPVGLALLGTEVVTVTSLDGTLDAAPAGSWPAGTAIVPLVAATLDDGQSVTQVTGGVMRCSITFLLDAAVLVDVGAMSRRAWPESVVEGGSGIGVVAGVYGVGLMASDPGGNLTISRSGQLKMVGPHTIEFWVKPPSGVGYLNLMAMEGGSGYIDWVGAEGRLVAIGWPVPLSCLLPTGVWSHVAISRDSLWTCRLFVGGKVAQVGTDAFYQTAYPAISSIHLLGARAGRAVFTGAIDDVRMTHACRYTADFTPSPCVIGEGDPYWSDVAFLLTGDSSRWGVGPLGPTSDPRAMVLPMTHNWAESPEVTIARPVDELDSGTGLRHTRPIHDGSVLSWAQREILDSPADIAAFRAFLQVHRGSAVRFFAGPPGATIEVQWVANGQVRTDQARFLRDQPPAIIAVLLDTGWKYYAFGEGYATPGTLPISNHVATHPAGTILAARAIYRARLLGDAVEINYRTPGVAEVSLPLVAVAQ